MTGVFRAECFPAQPRLSSLPSIGISWRSRLDGTCDWRISAGSASRRPWTTSRLRACEREHMIREAREKGIMEMRLASSLSSHSTGTRSPTSPPGRLSYLTVPYPYVTLQYLTLTVPYLYLTLPYVAAWQSPFRGRRSVPSALGIAKFGIFAHLLRQGFPCVFQTDIDVFWWASAVDQAWTNHRTATELSYRNADIK